MAGTARDPFVETVAKCTFCLDLNKTYLRRQWRKFGLLHARDIPYGFTLAKMAENAKRLNCKGCKLVLRAAQRIKDEHDMDFRHAQFEFLSQEASEEGKLQGLCLRLSMLYPTHGVSEETWERAKAHPEVFMIKVASRPSEDDMDRDFEDRIFSPQYEIFTAEGCGNEDASDWNIAADRLPTRLLDLGEDLTLLTADPILHITSKSEGEQQAEYACLSHCWGTQGLHEPPLETTRANIDAFMKEGIVWDKLPKTFQDSIICTRKLGIRYLWIDSLCIIQRDSEDWLHEAGRMASVYDNAKLTLAAAASSNSHGGLFRVSDFQPHEISLGSDGNDGIRLRRYPDPQFFDYQHEIKSGWEEGFSGVSPLLQRAWVFQERILSRRVLYFTPLELVFECRESNSTESGQQWANSTVKHRFNAAYNPSTPREQLSAMWRSLVDDFTHLKLTRASDTLPAMAGLAKRLLPPGSSSSPYLAGLWRDALLADMMWEVSTPERVSWATNPTLPSWSWARTTAPKSFIHGAMATQLCDAIDARCESQGGGDIFLRVSSGHVIMSGFLLPAKSSKMGVKIKRAPRVAYNAARDYDWAEPSDPSEEGDKVEPGDRVFVLPLAIFAEEEENGYGKMPALVLKRCRTKEGDVDGTTTLTFRRIGIISTSLLYIQEHYSYVLEGNDTLITLLRRHIALGESMLAGVVHEESGKPARYKIPASAADRSNSVVLGERQDDLYKPHKNAAGYWHLCHHGPDLGNPPSDFGEFYGARHLELLKELLGKEEQRVAEWKKCDEAGGEQVQRRRVFRII
ncbi:HET domain protein [Podospora didyma]|uniref:HET domain protein n=1 Tax=Podospora didyma TaxID=330526 RepID=A0AAE0U1P8_9PEZI|nr:HET domain protein [Podospora didyma]